MPIIPTKNTETGEAYRDDFDKLRDLLFKSFDTEQRLELTLANDMAGITNQMVNKNIEKFISQLHVISQKILKDYNQPILETLASWKDAKDVEDESSGSDSLKKSEKNDFRVDK